MTQRQVKVRLDEDLIDRLKNGSADMNISFSSLVNELLSKGLQVDNWEHPTFYLATAN
jgi:predicted DNA binding CopG/RHH family protein